MSKVAIELDELAKTDKYLFHGSVARMEVIEPRQAYNNSRPDGQPTVAATSYYQLAIFRAVMLAAKAKVEPSKYSSGFSFNDGKLSFRASRKTLAAARSGSTGFVYVLDKSNFQKHSSMEYRSSVPVRPFKMFEVDANDLPEDVEIID